METPIENIESSIDEYSPDENSNSDFVASEWKFKVMLFLTHAYTEMNVQTWADEERA